MNTNESSGILPSKGQPAHQALDEKGKARLRKAVQDFESLFVGYMLKSMRDSMPKDEDSGDEFGGDMLQSMFDTELAKHISRNSNLGLGELLYKSVTGESLLKGSQPVAKPEPGNIPAPPPAERPQVPVTRQQTPAPVVQAAPRDTVARKVSAFEPLIQEAADEHGVDPNLLKAVMASESAGNALARSSKNAKGLMQLVDTTANAMGVRNVWNPKENIQGGAKYLQQLLERFSGNLEHAIASYNAGPGAVEKHRGVPPFKETREYVHRVMNYLHYFEQQPGASNDND